ncbi:MAG: dihydroorotate dehydrogenase [Synergistaceae bacterium]
MDNKLSIKIGTVEIPSPVIPASGVWPYEEEFWYGTRTEFLGAACTKAISLNPRRGNDGIRLWETPSGILNSIGLQNVGVHEFVKRYMKRVLNGDVLPIANVVMERPEETVETLKTIEDAGGMPVVELNISCPNVDGDGMSWGMEAETAAKAVAAARKAWNGPLWVKMTPQTATPALVAKAIENEGADALVVANTWLGMGMNMETGKPAFNRVVAGLSGPAVFPLSLRLVWQVCGAVNIPVIGCGGVSTAEDCAAMLMAGASAVEVGTAFFTDLNAGKTICNGLYRYIEKYGVTNLSDLIGFARK